MASVEDILKRYNIKRDVIEIPGGTREDLAKLIHDLDFKTGAEIGVAGGKYSEILMKYNPQMKLWGVDPYTSYSGYKDYVKKGTFEGLEKEAHDRLDKYPNYTFIREMSMDALQHFADEELDFVYIDANHSEPWVSQDIREWSKKVKPGGIVSGDDYARIHAKGQELSSNWVVIPAIKKYCKDNEKQLFIWGLEAKIFNLPRDAVRSWMFIK